MAIYTGHTGRAVLIGPDNISYNLSVHKYVVSTKTTEEDVTTAHSLPGAIGRLFVASQMPRIDVELDGFWTSFNNPFGTSDPLRAGFEYSFKLFFDKEDFVPNVDATLLILGCEVSGSVRDAVRFMLTGVIQGPISLIDLEAFPEELPRFFPLQ